SHNSSERVAATSGSRDRNLGQSPKTPLSVAMFMLVGNEIVYLFSGNDKKYMHDYNAQYLIQWQMIKYAAENGYKKYNFYGIRSLPNPNSPSNGIYKFKKGFDGQVVELIGSFERPLSPLYYFHRLLASVKHKLKTLSHNSHKATSESICKLDQTTPSATKE
ncbi:MAG: peptidoglycan bridge formation glycyltransferase FemA/FemB family protein, partial [Candidatus Saccharibacteria bacterium]|nr:peptidoglycan bridge formation glycyltransferase FemA/FemB family protein [Candidatus Saccharibacteria bacterium]